jgi:hypothetical protein
MIRRLRILFPSIAVTSSLLLSLILSVGASPLAPTLPPSTVNAYTDAYTIKLRSREFTPTPGLSSLDRSRLNAISAQGGARIHALLQMHEIPSPAERATLAARGIQLLTYVPNRTWVAAIPGDAVDRVAATPGVRWLGELRADDKLAPEIRSEHYSAWHYDATRDVVAVVIQLHEDVDLDVARDLVLERGGMVRGYVRSVNSVTAEMPRLALQDLAADDRVLWVETAIPSLTPTNDGARDALNVNVLHPAPYNAAPTYNLDGSGVDVLVFDGGQVGDHPDFGTRLTHGDTEDVSDHSTHVAGTVGGDGTESAGDGGAAWQWRGMAPNVDIISYAYEWDETGTLFYTNLGDIDNDWDDAKNTHGADIGTASLGSNLAWNGAIDPVNYSCAFEGNYGVTSQLMDGLVRGSLGEPYIATWAAGNERGSPTNPGPCGTGYSTTAPPACAKNPIHVGATNSNNDSMTTFSSWGPCDDGRLKPVIVAPGCQSNGDGATHSTIADLFIDVRPWYGDGVDDYDFPYDDMCGTSMATPAVAGVAALMLQQYRDTYNTAGEFLPATVKALLMNTATDLGNAGPDFQHGYGLVDAQAAVDAIIAGQFREGTMGATAEVDWYAIQVPPGTAQLQVSLAWDDPAVAPLSTPALVNNLDLALLDPVGGLHQPWVLNPGTPANAATAGVDTLNNQEQVTVNTPAAGVWRVRVTGTAVPTAPQSYGLAATHNMISLDIANPTNATPTNVGYFGDPEKLLISLDLRDRHGGPLGVTIDSATDLAFSIGGEAPVGVFPGGNVGNFYWVLATPPTKPAAGCHNLQVTLFGLLSDVETNAVCYGATPQPSEDIMLVIDSSGSMISHSKMPATKDASKFFVTATGLGDMIGMDTFSTTAALKYPLTTVAGATQKDAANAAIDALVADGYTALGSGAQIANTELTTNGDASHNHTMVILSDGNENQTPYWGSVAGSIPADTVIHTVALGPSCADVSWSCPDEALLSDIASDFNGDYYRVLTGGSLQLNAASQASQLTNILADVYRSAAEETYGWDRVWEASADLGEYCGNISDTYQIHLENNLTEALFAVNWERDAYVTTPLELKRPNGTTVNPSDPDVVEYRQVGGGFRTSGHEQYRISSPQSGDWTVNILGAYSACGEYVAMAEARSQTNLMLLSPRPGQHIGFCQPVPLLTAFMGPSQPVLGAQVQAQVMGPLTFGQLVNVTLFDDGNHGDGLANDGWYGNTYNPCKGAPPQGDPLGSYQIKVSASGINEDDDPVSRTDSGAYHATGSTTGDPDPPPATILLVDDDENDPDVRGTYTGALDSVGVAYDVWDVVNDGPPSTGNLTPYQTVIWFTGDDIDATLSAADEAALGSFLDGGGKLFLSSQNYFYDVGFVNTFMQNYLHVSAVQNDVGATSVKGVAGNAVGDGLGPYALTSLAEFADRLTPRTPGGLSAFVNQSDSTVAVSFADGSYCTLFAAFPFERLNSGNAEEMMERILSWKCWDPSILVSPSEVEGEVWQGALRSQSITVSNPGEGKLAWAVNSGPIHLWAVTDADGQVPTFLRNLDPALVIAAQGVAPDEVSAVTAEVRLDVCAITTGVADCCSGATCSAAELLDQDVLIVYNDQALAGAGGLGNMLADFVDQGGAVIVAMDALAHSTGGLGGRFMNEDYSPLKSASTSSAGAASLGSYDSGHPLMSDVSAAGALSHLDVLATSGDVEIVASWDSGEPFVAIKRQEPAPVAGRVIAINAPLEDGQWSGDVDEIVTNAIQWLSDNLRDLPWLEPSCSAVTLPPEPFAVTAPASTSVDYVCPLVNSGDDWAMSLTFDGRQFQLGDTVDAVPLRGKVTIEHNVADQGRVNIPVSANLVQREWSYLPLVLNNQMRAGH